MLEGIAWQQPWLAPYRERGQPAAARVLQGNSVAEALNASARDLDPSLGMPLFVPQAELPEGRAYEAFIFDTGRVPTRDNLHDFFNGLIWLHQPALKRRLNALQAAEIGALGVGGRRGAARDALTLFDENAALLLGPEPLLEALRQQDWPRLFITLRPLWAQTRLQLFGHALLEKLVRPRKPITAHVWIDEGANPALKPFAPLPVLGVPGWWPDNEDAGFYADASVFRQAGKKPSIDR